MSDQIRAVLFQLSDPRKVALLLNALFLALFLTGCGDAADIVCPPGSSGSAGCGGG